VLSLSSPALQVLHVKNVDSHPKNSKKSNTSQAKTVGGRTALRELTQNLPASATQRLEEPKKKNWIRII
jgi:hypothetical protein